MIKPLTCPVCRKTLPPQVTEKTETFPFCSDRCRNVDLFRWSEGKYSIVEDLADRPDVVEKHLEELERAFEEETPDEGESW